MTSEPFDPTEGVSRQIGYYLAGLEYTREQIRDGVHNLSNEQIAAKLLPEAHSIGQLILHTAEAEYWWIQCVIGGRSREEFERREFYHIPEDEDYKSRDHSAEFCIAHLDLIGAQTEDRLSDHEDEDLEKFFSWTNISGQKIEMSLRGILTHLIDHQATHKGQILMLRRLMG